MKNFGRWYRKSGWLQFLLGNQMLNNESHHHGALPLWLLLWCLVVSGLLAVALFVRWAI